MVDEQNDFQEDIYHTTGPAANLLFKAPASQGALAPRFSWSSPIAISRWKLKNPSHSGALIPTRRKSRRGIRAQLRVRLFMAFGGYYRIFAAFVKRVFELTGGCQGELKNGRKRRSRR